MNKPPDPERDAFAMQLTRGGFVCSVTRTYSTNNWRACFQNHTGRCYEDMASAILSGFAMPCARLGHGPEDPCSECDYCRASAYMDGVEPVEPEQDNS